MNKEPEEPTASDIINDLRKNTEDKQRQEKVTMVDLANLAIGIEEFLVEHNLSPSDVMYVAHLVKISAMVNMIVDNTATNLVDALDKKGVKSIAVHLPIIDDNKDN